MTNLKHLGEQKIMTQTAYAGTDYTPSYGTDYNSTPGYADVDEETPAPAELNNDLDESADDGEAVEVALAHEAQDIRSVLGRETRREFDYDSAGGEFQVQRVAGIGSPPIGRCGRGQHLVRRAWGSSVCTGHARDRQQSGQGHHAPRGRAPQFQPHAFDSCHPQFSPPR